MRPSTWQYVLAANWLPVCWQWVWSFAAVGAVIWIMAPRLNAFGDPWFVLNCVVALVLSFLVGWFASIIPAWFVFGPILYSQGLENGGPFVPGDRVYIIAGKHRGTISQVYGTWQHETIRVELGECEKAGYTDIFAAYQLIREKLDEQSGEPEPPITQVLKSKGFDGGPVTASEKQ